MSRPRPYAVYYPGDQIGHCATLKNAILRGTNALLDNKYDGQRHVQVNVLLEGDHQLDLVRTVEGVSIRYPKPLWRQEDTLVTTSTASTT